MNETNKKYSWNPEKREQNIKERDLDMVALAPEVFNDPNLIIEPDNRQDYGEERFLAYGVADGDSKCTKKSGRNTMEKVVSMTAEEIRKNFDVKKAIAMAEAAPEFDDPNPGGKPIARGFAAFKEYLKQKGHPKSEKSKNTVSFQVAPELLKGLRSTGRGWQTRVNNYLTEGLKKGKLAAPTNN